MHIGASCFLCYAYLTTLAFTQALIYCIKTFRNPFLRLLESRLLMGVHQATTALYSLCEYNSNICIYIALYHLFISKRFTRELLLLLSPYHNSSAVQQVPIYCWVNRRGPEPGIEPATFRTAVNALPVRAPRLPYLSKMTVPSPSSILYLYILN